MNERHPFEVTGERLTFSSLMSGAYASAAVALFVLGIDAVRGTVLATPTAVGSVVLLGEPVGAVTGARLDVVALYSVFHLLASIALGLAVTLAYAAVPALRARPPLLVGVTFLALGAGAVAVDASLYPGLVTAVGALPTMGANLLASLVTVAFAHLTLGAQVPATAAVRVRPASRTT